jgi:3-hydroxybutyryl-CoA dehydrogenase
MTIGARRNTSPSKWIKGGTMEIKHVGVVGCGAMGSGIAQLVLKAGYTVTVREIDENFLAKGLGRITKGFEKLVEKGKISIEEKSTMLAHLSGTVSLADLSSCDLVIEAVFEEMSIKSELFKALDAVCKKETVFATNTSSLAVSEIAASTSRSNKFVGLHFFNPATVMPLVEVIKTIVTPPGLLQTVLDFGRKLGKTPIIAKDNAGFIVNRFLTPFLMDAMRGVGDGVASVADIDTAMKLGCNHPMGPLMLSDFIGLDVLLRGSSRMFEEYGEKRYAPPPILRRLVVMGFLGQKTGKGFYDWSDPRNPVPRDLGL